MGNTCSTSAQSQYGPCVRNPIREQCRKGLRMLLLLHALIPCLAAYTSVKNISLKDVGMVSAKNEIVIT